MSNFSYPPRQYDPPNLPWATGERPPRSELNPYGYWNKDLLDETTPECRYTDPVYLCSLCGTNTVEDPEGIEKWSIIIAHWLPFPVAVIALWCVYVKLDMLKERIYSPFLLMVGILFLAVGSMAEDVNHSTAMNWNACYDSAENFAKLYFYIFVGTGNACMPIALRKKDSPLVRTPTDSTAWYFFIGDWFTIIFTAITPLVWIFIDQKTCMRVFVFTQIGGTAIGIPYIYLNLGPSPMHLVVACVAYLAAFLGSVPIFTWLKMSGMQWVHAVLATTFVIQEGGVFYCVYYVMNPPPKKTTGFGTGEETPLIMVK